MAYMCIQSGRECTRCKDCIRVYNKKPLYCPICDAELEDGEKKYRDIDGNYVGCQHCIEIEIHGED